MPLLNLVLYILLKTDSGLCPSPVSHGSLQGYHSDLISGTLDVIYLSCNGFQQLSVFMIFSRDILSYQHSFDFFKCNKEEVWINGKIFLVELGFRLFLLIS